MVRACISGHNADSQHHRRRRNSNSRGRARFSRFEELDVVNGSGVWETRPCMSGWERVILEASGMVITVAGR